MISEADDREIARACNKHDIGVIAMKGLITNAKAAFAFMRQYEYVVPIWGIQHITELEEFLGMKRMSRSLMMG